MLYKKQKQEIKLEYEGKLQSCVKITRLKERINVYQKYTVKYLRNIYLLLLAKKIAVM
jgi:hypothetical protein